MTGFYQKYFAENRDVRRFLDRLEVALTDFKDQSAQDLSAYITQNRAALEGQSTVLDVRREIASGMSNNAAVMQLFDNISVTMQASALSEKGVALVSVAGGASVVLLVFVLLWVIYQATSDTEILRLLGQVPVARGLITFTVTVGTIGVALALIGAAFISQAKDIKDRLNIGSQVLTALIAVLGTIVGFYYGTSDNGSGLFNISAQNVTPESIAPGGTLTVAATISGGDTPFSVTARIEEKDGDLVVEETDEVTGAIALLSLELPDDLTEGGELILSVTDASGRRIERSGPELEFAPAEDDESDEQKDNETTETE